MPVPALLAHDLVHTLGTRRVLDGVSLTASPGHRIGLIGENGAGKTTLLRLLAGVDEPDRGNVERPDELGFLHQELPYPVDATLTDVLDDALREAREDLAELDRAGAELATAAQDSPDHPHLLAAYGEHLQRAQERDAWDADRRASLVLDGLGLGSLPHDRTLGSLAGGQRSRLALAALLIRQPAALLLDEPTNHLDDEAAEFVEERLRALPGVVVVASHDRAFLDAVCTDLIDLDPSLEGPTRYGGNYTDYQAVKRAERERWQRRFEAEQEELEALRHSAGVTAHRVAPYRAMRDNEKMGYGRRGNRVDHQISRRVRNASRRLDDLRRAQVLEPPRPLRFSPPALARPVTDPGTLEVAADAAPGPVLSLRGVRVPGRMRLDSLEVSECERLLVTGANGSGKSTLLAVLAGELEPRGEVRRRPGLSVALLAQDTVFERPDRTVRDTYTAGVGAERAESVPLVSLGLMEARDLDKRVGELSVGQRRRLALALLVASPPALLLLDEPTNHLSPRLCDELEDALGPGPGAVVVASHDRRLRSRWQGRELRMHAEPSRA
ncbi:putative ABC transporter ATP-binding protein YheS [Streptomyces sp. YIM 130001]|uniref:ABC-F family ATP-binding cassette domain-containing protein n=1 Tax=Streptomyces sp. YIM 130001 TaxID=2259644 RepID=UPI000E65E4D0|nr:ABC-F family ATP-binding cassette domain-containing protein [Streptomyces sp. YIM 130001]RII14722.1 putative ABC transporter ATP-binding protein YheS [Streptomyces sp. YIM 130001]